MSRTDNVDSIKKIGKEYDAILNALKLPPEQQRNWFDYQNRFTKFHYNTARNMIIRGELDLNSSLPSGTELSNERLLQLEKQIAANKEYFKQQVEKNKQFFDSLSDQEKLDRETIAMYGGPENYKRGFGLGS